MPHFSKCMLIDTADLDQLLYESPDDVVVIDARSYTEYAAGHIRGAVNLDLFAFHWNDTTPDGMRGFDAQTVRLFSFVGASRARRIVVYDGQSGMLAARGVWMLLYMSHRGAFMLDGGFAKWRAESRPVEVQTRGSIPVVFEPQLDRSIITGYADVADNLNRLVIIDSRSPAEYDGSVTRAARGGHIPGAINIEWKRNLSDEGDGRFKDGEQLASLYANIPRDSDIITYCQGGYRAAHSFLALKRAGYTNVRVYLGSWGEWGNMPELPVSND